MSGELLLPGGDVAGGPRISTLKERETGERGQPVHQLIQESRVTGLWCGLPPLPVVPVAAHGCGCVGADGEPCLGEIALLQIAGSALAPITDAACTDPAQFRSSLAQTNWTSAGVSGALPGAPSGTISSHSN